MPDKYSLAKCEQYGRRLAARLCQQHFGPQPEATLDGPALLKLTPLRQANLLVLHQLLGRWQHEATQLRSPYFDFEAAPVQAALAQFMNVLSRHISMGRAALEPLLAQAVAYTLLLATDPAAAFERLLLPPPGGPGATADAPVPLPYLQERLRYLDQGKALFEGFLASLPAGSAPLSRDFLLQRFELYRASHYQQVPALTPLVAELSALLPLTEADLWDDGPSKPAPPRPAATTTSPAATPAAPAPPAEAPPTVPTAAPTPTPAPKFAAPAPTTAATASQPPANPASEQPTPAPEAPPAVAPPAPSQPAPAPQPVAAEAKPAPRPVVPSFTAAGAEASAGVPLYEKLKATQPAGPHLAETLRSTAAEAAPRLAERGAPRVGTLREGISINQRYSFIYELFNGETGEYNAAIEHLDQLPTAAAAQAYVQQELAARYDWARKEEHVGKLLKLLERRFAGA